MVTVTGSYRAFDNPASCENTRAAKRAVATDNNTRGRHDVLDAVGIRHPGSGIRSSRKPMFRNTNAASITPKTLSQTLSNAKFDITAPSANASARDASLGTLSPSLTSSRNVNT
jgi:hypothetical protein